MSDIKNNDPQLASEPIASGYGMPNGITISFESLWDMLNSINLTPNIKIKLGERLIASAKASAHPTIRTQKRKLISSKQISQLAGSLNMDVSDNWKSEKDDQLARKYL